MASIFTYDPDPPRVSSPWSTSGTSSPQANPAGTRGLAIRTRSTTILDSADPDSLSDYGITKLEPEPQEGPTEYKLHLLLRPRRPYLSMSTGHLVAGSYHSRTSLPAASTSASPSYDATPRPMQAKSSQSRQQRLQGLTTQLLWRLQQSSPFHSSTTFNLVVPVLPEATPRLGVPSKPARLLPGLEESQGALYEIGVADDGTFVGLTQDELDESVTNLQAMAASLGCGVEILRRVIVGKCEWADDSPTEPEDPAKNHSDSLWVAEALVTPDLDFYNISPIQTNQNSESTGADSGPQPIFEEDYSATEQIRISIAGPSTAGKSSLLGTLTSSLLDNGRGKSRLSLLKHRHEISSGITSSVAQELVGYSDEEPPTVVNYASGNVTAWNDIHASSRGGRLAFVSDLPGSVRYLKSTLRGLVSWAPHYVMLCIPANCGDEAEGEIEQVAEIDLCLAYLELCLKLEVPILIVITKLDVASRSGLRDNLTKVLSALKTAGRKPAMLPASPAGDKPLDLQHVSAMDSNEARKSIAAATGNWSHVVPIIMTSAVDGTGIGKLHAFLRYLPIPSRPSQRALRITKPAATPNIFDIDEVFAIPPSKVYSRTTDNASRENRGMVLCGLVRHGSISIGDELVIGPVPVDTSSSESGREALQPSLSRSSGPAPSGDFSASFAQKILSGRDAAQAKWQRVRVVSVRNLRLSVHRLKEDQVGTIGIETINPATENNGRAAPRIGRIRKGMVLSDFHTTSASLPPTPLPPTLSLTFHTGFIATFPAAEFSSPTSPPLLLGGNAIVYISNIRTTVRVVCMALAGTGDGDRDDDDEEGEDQSSPSEPEFFRFDGDSAPGQDRTPGSGNGNITKRGFGSDDHANSMRRSSATDISKVVSSSTDPAATATGPSATSLKEDVRITFALVTSVEWVETGSPVLVMPGISMASASSSSAAVAPASASASASGTVVISGLEGFVGTVCDVISGGEGVGGKVRND
ncbi:uncharacterized protein PFLUO_LOCUS4745 [Penicillium psychrofluorescens]|uniref:uncharacterized protein n=1 Tax=Penicillium psychrofluorescens TaxID=3158075 RepID=UPI003CCCEEFA